MGPLLSIHYAVTKRECLKAIWRTYLAVNSCGSWLKRPTTTGTSMPICDEEVNALLRKDAIEDIAERNTKFVSGIFVIPKANGGFRPVINLKPVNKFIRHIHFKMEGLSLLKELVRKGDHFTKLDLTDAYLSVPLHKDDRKFVQFQ
mgnify:CR=1 FL=1